MIKKSCYFVIFALLGIIYTDWGLLIEDYLSDIWPELNLHSFFTPLVVIDIVIGIICIYFLKLFRHNEIWKRWVKTTVYILTGICLSIITCFGWGMLRFILTMAHFL